MYWMSFFWVPDFVHPQEIVKDALRLRVVLLFAEAGLGPRNLLGVDPPIITMR